MFIVWNIYQHLPKQFITQQNVGIHRPAPWVAYGYEKRFQETGSPTSQLFFFACSRPPQQSTDVHEIAARVSNV
jgi:hypothetical protein